MRARLVCVLLLAASSATAQPNVVVILFDSLRADHLEPYGAEDIPTPAVAAFADQSITFENARSNSPWTRPAVASLFTSRYPHEHGINTPQDYLPENMPVLAETMQAAGYDTVLVTTSPQTYPEWGFGRGFNRVLPICSFWWELKNHPQPKTRADRMWSEQIEPVLDAGDGQPVFLFLHELDPHHPYDPPETYSQQFPVEDRPHVKMESFEWRSQVERGEVVLDDADVAFLKARYAAKVAFTDAYFGHILGHIEKRLGPDTIFILTSDHGEEFLEHGQITHGKTLYEESLRIPLIVRRPDGIGAGTRRTENVQIVDLFPTIASLIGIVAPESSRGNPLFLKPERAEQEPAFRLMFFSHALGYVPYREDAVLAGRLKMIRRTPLIRSDVVGPRFALFNWRDDPSEKIDLYDSTTIEFEILKDALEREFENIHSADTKTTDPLDLEATLDELRSLGYL